MLASNVDISGIGGAYHRVSEGDDIDRQRVTTSGFAARHNATIKAENNFEDLNWKRDEADIRPAFQKMIKQAEAGRLNWIVIDQPTRFGTKDIAQRLKYFLKLHDAGCRVYTAEGKRLGIDNLVALIETGIDAKASEEELKQKGQAVIGGKATKAADGQWMGGYIPYGTAVACLDHAGKEKWRVEIIGRKAKQILRMKISNDGIKTEYNGARNFPAAEEHDRLELRPTSNAYQLEIVAKIFDWYFTESVPYSAIARRLNRMKVLTTYGSTWRSGHVINVLENPIYTGRMPYNRHSTAKYSQHLNGQRCDVAAEEFGIFRRRDKTDWIFSRKIFDPIIDPKLFAAVEKKMDAHKRTKKARSPQMWLSGLLFCAHCGKELRANVRRKKLKSGKESVAYEYICATYSKAATAPDPEACRRHVITHEEAEQYVRRYLADCGQHLRGDRPAADGKIDVPRQPYNEMLDAAAEMRRRTGAPETGISINQLAARYEKQFATELPHLKAELAKLDAEHGTMTSRMMRLPDTATLAIAKVQKEVSAMEDRIVELKRLMENAAERMTAAMQLVMEQFKAWDAARIAIDDDTSGRTKRNSVEQIIKSLSFSFRTIAGKKRCAIEPTEVTISPVSAQYPTVTASMRCGIFW